MFGFQGGESADEVARKKGYMKDAQHRWPFLTNFDCSTITTAGQLSSMVKVRSSVPEKQAQQDVDGWMKDKDFHHPQFGEQKTASPHGPHRSD
jgi:hypothetical protein